MEKYGQRVAAARGHVGWSQGKLAREIGITQPSLSELESGDGRSKHSYKIAQKTGVRMEWLENNVGPMIAAPGTDEAPREFRRADTENINVQQMPRDFPVLGGALCGEDGLFEFNGQTLDFVQRPPRMMGVKDGYALFINGKCMSPWREHGGLVYVHPHMPVKIDDYVVVQLKQTKDGGVFAAYIKRLVRRTATNIVLHQFNPAKDITIPTAKVAKIHHVVDWSELMGF